MERDFKGVWFPKWLWLSRDLTDREKMFYVEIESLDKENGCFASNQHFSELFGLSISRCSEIINSLDKKGFISIESVRKGKQIVTRILRTIPLRETRRTPSENTKNPFGKHEEPLRKTRRVIIPITNTNEREMRAHDFFKNNYELAYEKFLMDYQSKIKDFQKFTDTFDDVFDKEKLEYDFRVVRGRINQFARNWVENQNRKYYQNRSEENIPAPNYLKNAF